ncbi:unnamed protein product [Ectocarpus sp. 12 AP-2014]
MKPITHACAKNSIRSVASLGCNLASSTGGQKISTQRRNLYMGITCSRLEYGSSSIHHRLIVLSTFVSPSDFKPLLSQINAMRHRTRSSTSVGHHTVIGGRQHLYCRGVTLRTLAACSLYLLGC